MCDSVLSGPTSARPSPVLGCSEFSGQSCEGLPTGSIVVPFSGLYLESYQEISKRSY